MDKESVEDTWVYNICSCINSIFFTRFFKEIIEHELTEIAIVSAHRFSRIKNLSILSILVKVLGNDITNKREYSSKVMLQN